MGSIIACLENKLTAVKSILKISSFEKLSVLFNTMRQSFQSLMSAGQL